ncbi:MAG: hypothetical protein WD399_02910 [Thermoleophilaceae bacterium]
MSDQLDSAIRELEEAARELRDDPVPDRAAELVDRCAEIAATIGRELDLAARAADSDTPAAGQERLL